jgi:hypothetical protein
MGRAVPEDAEDKAKRAFLLSVGSRLRSRVSTSLSISRNFSVKDMLRELEIAEDESVVF